MQSYATKKNGPGSDPDQPNEFKPFLTWGEEQDLKLAEMKKLREQEEARARERAPAS